jgi:hypothetical protein
LFELEFDRTVVELNSQRRRKTATLMMPRVLSAARVIRPVIWDPKTTE